MKKSKMIVCLSSVLALLTVAIGSASAANVYPASITSTKTEAAVNAAAATQTFHLTKSDILDLIDKPEFPSSTGSAAYDAFISGAVVALTTKSTWAGIGAGVAAGAIQDLASSKGKFFNQVLIEIVKGKAKGIEITITPNDNPYGYPKAFVEMDIWR
ncbi:hypothetical protein ABE354_19485 [Brevibacillus laterosporus]|uniref:hypothetical protein n=2 Tax=Bacillati TaxID=1783272 RepID=UPI003D1F6DEA